MRKYWMVVTALATFTTIIVFSTIYAMSTMINPCSIFGVFGDANAMMSPAITKQLYNDADLVVIGKVLHSAAGCEGLRIMTFMQVEVEEYLKNPQKTRYITAKAFGGSILGYNFQFAESPIFNSGERALFFLHKDKPTDRVYSASSYSYGLREGSGKESLRFVDLKPKDDTVSTMSENSSKQVTLFAEAFFGYEGETMIMPTSFAYYNSTTVTPRYEINNMIDLYRFGLSIEPARNIILLNTSSTAEVKLRIHISENAVPGLYGFDITAFDVNDLDYYGYDASVIDTNILDYFLPVEGSHAVILVNVTNPEYHAHTFSMPQIQSEHLVIARFEPEQITLTKRVPVNVTVSLTYNYTGSGIPQKVKLVNIFLDGDYITHKGSENLRPDETIRRLFEQRWLGPAVPELVPMGALISWNDVDFHSNLKVGETVHVATFKIAADRSYPDELLSKKMIVRPDLTFSLPLTYVRANEIEVTVTG